MSRPRSRVKADRASCFPKGFGLFLHRSPAQRKQPFDACAEYAVMEFQEKPGTQRQRSRAVRLGDS